MRLWHSLEIAKMSGSTRGQGRGQKNDDHG